MISLHATTQMACKKTYTKIQIDTKKDTNTDTDTDTNTDKDTNTEIKREKHTDKDIVEKSERRIYKIIFIYNN